VTECDVLIIGGGPGGATAAIYAARAALKTIVLDKSLSAGALGMTGVVDNFPGIPHSTGPAIVETMRKQAESFGAEFRKETVVGVDFSDDVKKLFTNEDEYAAKAVILASGGMARGKTVPGEDELVGRGVSYCATCDAAFFKEKKVAVIGNNEQAAEEALFLTRFASEVFLFHSTKTLGVSEEIAKELRDNGKIKLFPSRSLVSFVGDSKLEAVHVKGSDGEKPYDVNGAFIFLQGNKPSIEFLGGTIDTNTEGCIVVEPATMMTNMSGVYAIGDLLCNEVKQAVLACAEGCTAAVQADKFIHGRTKVRKDWK